MFSMGLPLNRQERREESAAAIKKFNGQELGGPALKVNQAKPRENRAGF
jgi:hypothetical protein